MRNLPLPSRDDAQEHLQTALKKYQYKGKRLGYRVSNPQLKAILALYDDYDVTRAAPSLALQGGNLSASLCQRIHDAFDLTQKKRKLRCIRKALTADIGLCPICGIHSVKDLDHFLPRSVFKPLAIYTRNLVPLCRECNGIKLTSFGTTGAATSLFVHAYYDILPDVQFIRADVKIVGEALDVTFYVDQTAGLDPALCDRLDNQITKLELNDRYRRELNTLTYNHAVALYQAYASKRKAGVKTYLRLVSDTLAGQFYRNHWQPVLLDALANHDAFCDGDFAKVLPLPDAQRAAILAAI